MAAIIECVSISGQALYSTIHNASGQLWNTSGQAFENFNSAHWGNYATSLTEQSPTGYYVSAFPSQITAGKYTEVFYQQAGGSPATTDAVIGNTFIYWTGTVEEQGFYLGINGSTMPELNSVPPATPTIQQALMLLYMSLRNSHSATAIQETVANDAGTTIGTASLSDNGVTTTKGKFS